MLTSVSDVLFKQYPVVTRCGTKKK